MTGNNFPWRWGAHSHSPRSLQEWQVTQTGYATALRGLRECGCRGTSLIHRLSVPALPRDTKRHSERSCKETDIQSWNRERRAKMQWTHTRFSSVVSAPQPWNSHNPLVSLSQASHSQGTLEENNPSFRWLWRHRLPLLISQQLR